MNKEYEGDSAEVFEDEDYKGINVQSVANAESIRHDGFDFQLYESRSNSVEKACFEISFSFSRYIW